MLLRQGASHTCATQDSTGEAESLDVLLAASGFKRKHEEVLQGLQDSQSEASSLSEAEDEDAGSLTDASSSEDSHAEASTPLREADAGADAPRWHQLQAASSPADASSEPGSSSDSEPDMLPEQQGQQSATTAHSPPSRATAEGQDAEPHTDSAGASGCTASAPGPWLTPALQGRLGRCPASRACGTACLPRGGALPGRELWQGQPRVHGGRPSSAAGGRLQLSLHCRPAGVRVKALGLDRVLHRWLQTALASHQRAVCSWCSCLQKLRADHSDRQLPPAANQPSSLS